MTQGPFGDIPLFREIQKLIDSAQGQPVNLEIARQVATAVALGGAQETNDPAIERALVEAVHPAELLLSGYTRLPLDEPVRATAVDRQGWVTATLEGWGWLFEHMSVRFTNEMTKLASEEGAAVGPIGAAMGPIAPLFLGLQVGTLVGHLAKESLGRYDIPIARQDGGRLFVVGPNVGAAADEYSLEREAVVRWLAVREIARHLALNSAPWVLSYSRSLITEVVDSTDIDMSDLQRRLVELQSQSPEAIGEESGFDGEIPFLATERRTKAVERLQAFAAAVEGYAAHSSGAVAPEVLPEAARIEEAMARRAIGVGPGRKMLDNLMGTSIDASLRAAGTTFCAAVVQLRGITTLNEMWAAPDNSPTLEEIKDPFAWLERVAPAKPDGEPKPGS
jgi:putative hydrolase